MTRTANRHSNVRVGTTQRSIAAMASAWLRRNVRQVWDGGPRRRIMYLETVDSAISNPSLSSSPWMRGASPQWVLRAHPSDELAQLKANSGPPWPTARFPIGPKPCSMPSQDRVRLNDASQTKQPWPEPGHPY